MTQDSLQASPRGPLQTYVAYVRLKVADLWQEVAKFGAIGLIAMVIDLGISNLLWMSPMFSDKPLTAKVISVVAATTFAYFGNRFWTYRDRMRQSMTREYVLFFVLNAVALGISLGCMWFSHYALGLDSVIANNISANVIGLGLGTLFRFWSYRKYVFVEGEVSDKEILELSEA